VVDNRNVGLPRALAAERALADAFAATTRASNDIDAFLAQCGLRHPIDARAVVRFNSMRSRARSAATEMLTPCSTFSIATGSARMDQAHSTVPYETPGIAAISLADRDLADGKPSTNGLPPVYWFPRLPPRGRRRFASEAAIARTSAAPSGVA
jgi:hypothetical protein